MAMLPWWIHYPNVNNEIINLDWILQISNENTDKIENFIGVNTIKYADPILWDITSQYEANTIVVDPQTGDAYISTKAVPYGVALSNEGYWTRIYNYASEIHIFRKQIAADEQLSTTASAPRSVDDLVFLNGLLYRVTAPMIVGDSYVVGSNCTKTTINAELLRLHTSISAEARAEAEARAKADATLAEADTALGQRIDDEADARADADTALGGRIDDEIQAREDADTALGGRIDDEIQAREDADTALGGRIDAEADARADADDELREMISTIKTNTVVNVRDFGAIGDANYYDKANNTYWADPKFGVSPHNDVQAFEDAIAYAIEHNIHTVFIPKGFYYLPNKQFTLSENTVTFSGENGTNLISTGLTEGAFISIECSSRSVLYFGSSSILNDITIQGAYFENNIGADSVTGIRIHGAWCQHKSIDNIGVSKFNIGIHCEIATEFKLNRISVVVCDTGLKFSEGTYNPMPAWLVGSTIELCARGIEAKLGGYSTLFCTDCGLSGGSQVYNGMASVKFVNCRFEIALDDCADTNGSPIVPFNFYAMSGSDSLSGASFDSCQFLFTKNGVNEGKLIFWNGPTYTRNSELDYLMMNGNSYVTSNSTIRFTNCQITPGDAGPKYMVNSYHVRSRVIYNAIDTNMYNNYCIAMGTNFVEGKLDEYSSNITKSGDTYVISSNTTISFNIPKMAHGISVHIQPTANNTVTVTSKAKDDYYNENTATRVITPRGDWTNQTICIPFTSRSEKVYITLSAGTISAKEHEQWFEFIY